MLRSLQHSLRRRPLQSIRCQQRRSFKSTPALERAYPVVASISGAIGLGLFTYKYFIADDAPPSNLTDLNITGDLFLPGEVLHKYAFSSPTSDGSLPAVATTKTVSAPTLLSGSSRFTLLYFTASWCPPCQRFTPILRMFEKGINGVGVRDVLKGKETDDEESLVDIVMVSCDQTEENLMSYIRSHLLDGFHVVPFESRHRLKAKYGCWAGNDSSDPALANAQRRHPGIPTVILVRNRDGLVMKEDGGADVKRDIAEVVETGDVVKLLSKWDKLR